MSTSKVLTITLKALDQASGPARVLEMNMQKLSATMLRLGPQQSKAIGTAAEAWQRYVNVSAKALAMTKQVMSVASGASMVRGASSLVSKVASVQAVVAGLVASRAVYGLKGMVDRIDEIGNRAQSMGISPETYSVLEYAAEKANQSVDTLASSYLTAQANLATFAATGKGPAARAIKELNLSVTDGTGRVRSMAELLGEVDAQLRGLSNPERQAALRSLFGKSGGEAWNRIFAKGLGESIGDLRRLDAIVTPQDVAAANRISDAMNRVKLSWRGVYQDVILGIEPAVTRMLNNTSTWIVTAKQNVQGLVGVLESATSGDQNSRDASRLLSELRERAIGVLGTSVIELAKLAANTLVSVIGTNVFVLLPRVAGFLKDTAIDIWNKLVGGKSIMGYNVPRAPEAESAYLARLQRNIDMIKKSSGGVETLPDDPAARALWNERSNIGGMWFKKFNEERKKYFDFGLNQLVDAEKTYAAKTRELRLQQETETSLLMSDLGAIWEPTKNQLNHASTEIGKQWDKLSMTMENIRAHYGGTSSEGAGVLNDPLQSRVISLNFSKAWESIKKTLSNGVGFVTSTYTQLQDIMRKRAQQLADTSLEFRMKELQAQGTPESQRQLLELQQLKERIALQRQFGQQYGILADQITRVQTAEQSRLIVNQELTRIQDAAAKAEDLLTGNAQYRQALVTTGALDQLRADQLARTGTETYLATLRGLGSQLEDLKAKYPELGATVSQVMADMSKSAENYRMQLAGPTASDWMAGIRVEFAELRRKSGDWFSFAREGTQGVVNALTSDLAGALTSTRFAFDALGESLKQWAGNTLQMLARIAMQMVLIRAVSGIASAFTPVASTATATTGTVGRFGPSIFNRGGVAGSALSRRIPGYAGGGTVMNGLDIGRDSVIAMLAKREGVINRQGMQKIGAVGLAQINAGNVPSTQAAPVYNISINVSPPAGSSAADARKWGDAAAMALLDRLARDGTMRSNMRSVLGVRTS